MIWTVSWFRISIYNSKNVFFKISQKMPNFWSFAIYNKTFNFPIFKTWSLLLNQYFVGLTVYILLCYVIADWQDWLTSISPKTFCLQTCSQAADKFSACRQFSDKNSTKTLMKKLQQKYPKKRTEKQQYNVLYQFFGHGQKFLKLPKVAQN